MGPERLRGRPSVAGSGANREEIRRWLTPRVEHLIEVMDGMAGWVDATHVEHLVEACAPSFWQLATRSGLRLVTGPERDRTHQRYAADLAFLSGRGLGVRVLVDDTSSGLRTSELEDLVDRLCLPPSQIDLLLDIGPVADTPDVSRTALSALDVMGALASWRRVVLTAGAFPRTLEGLDAQPTRSVERHDWRLHGSLHAARSRLRGRVVFGDYSVEHVFSANIPSARRPSPQGWGLLRYTTPDRYLIARAPTRGPHHVNRARDMARWIVESGSFRGARGVGQSEGERWLRACAYGTGPRGSGNAEKWIQVGHVQHLNFVVNQLTEPRS